MSSDSIGYSVNALIRGSYVSLILSSSLATVTISESDIGSGSSASNFRGPMSTYNTYPSYPGQYQGSYASPSTVMSQPYYASYAPSGATSYSGYSTGAYQTSASPTERTYFSLNGKLVRSYKVRSYRVRRLEHHHHSTPPPRDNHLIDSFFYLPQRAQKHVLDLFPDMLQGIASSRIQFFVIRPGYSRGRYVGLRSYISKSAWPSEIDTLQEHETIGIEVRPSVSFTESVVSFFNRSRVL